MESEPTKSRSTAMKKKASVSDSSAKPTASKQSSFARKRRGRLKLLTENYGVLSCVCANHCQGKSSTDILKILEKRFPALKIRREDPAWLVRHAGLNEMLVFKPASHDDYQQRLRDNHATLDRVEVISSSEVVTIAKKAANMLVHMIRVAARQKRTVNIGVAGGYTLRAIMRALAFELTQPLSGMPKTVHFRALAAGFHPGDPSTDPNAFTGLFNDRLIPVELKFTGLSAPAIIGPHALESLREYEDIQAAFDSVNGIDIFVTSGTSWHDCSALSSRLTDEDRKILVNHEVVGDLLWRPISRSGPIEVDVSRRAFTLVELAQLRQFVSDGKQVLVAMAPCGICRELKGALLNCVLEQKLVTHLVVDTLSAGQSLGENVGR